MIVLITQPDRLLGAELRHFLALQAVAEEGSFGRAATRLGYTQSAVSQQIQALERIVGEKLVERPGGPRAVSLTEAGKLLLRHADAIVARVQAAAADLESFSAGAAGSLRVGSYQSVSARILPAVIRRFREEWPKVEVELRESEVDERLEEQLEEGELDVSFVILPTGARPLESEQLLVDPHVLIVPKGSPLAHGATPPTLRQVTEHPLIAYRNCRTMQTIEESLRRNGREPRIVFRTDDNGTVQGLVAAGLGVAIVPRLTVQPLEHEIEMIDMSERLPPRLIGVAWHRDRYRTPAARAFVDTARNVCTADSQHLAAA
jgi:molybdate transport repressor ModE-like protein